MDWKVGDKLVDRGVPHYGVGRICKLDHERSSIVGPLVILFEFREGPVYRKLDDPELRKLTKLELALK